MPFNLNFSKTNFEVQRLDIGTDRQIKCVLKISDSFTQNLLVSPGKINHRVRSAELIYSVPIKKFRACGVPLYHFDTGGYSHISSKTLKG